MLITEIVFIMHSKVRTIYFGISEVAAGRKSIHHETYFTLIRIFCGTDVNK